MKKCRHVEDNTEDLKDWEKNFQSIEGIVNFSEIKYFGRGNQILCLKLKEYNEDIIIKENHRIDVGEIVRIHYKLNNLLGERIFCEAYEIINSNEEVIHRYKSHKDYNFIED